MIGLWRGWRRIKIADDGLMGEAHGLLIEMLRKMSLDKFKNDIKIFSKFELQTSLKENWYCIDGNKILIILLYD